MTAIDRTPTGSARFRHAELLRITLPFFTATLFLSALLLFSVQPMFAKMVLPLLGGSPGVWSVAMVFFQAMLLLGYAYAHGMIRLFHPRVAVIIHLAVFALAVFALPLGLSSGFDRPPEQGQALWLIALFGVSIGLPFFAVAANAPMLQAWFARTGHPQASDPYFLYGASNLGSFIALLAYPVLAEPFLTLRSQSLVWSGGFAVLMVMIAGAGLLMIMAARTKTAETFNISAAASPGWRDKFIWIALAFVPSAMLVAVTSHISTDIASAPFLWVVPLAIFLVTFIVTFRRGGEGMHHWVVRLLPFVIAPTVVGLFGGARVYWQVVLLLDLAILALTAMMCHRELYLRRPDANFLTGFYLWISVGGALGGIFAGLVAPAIFPDIWEYPILIVLALLCRPGAFANGLRPWLTMFAWLAVLIVLVCLPSVFGVKIGEDMRPLWTAGLVALSILLFLNAFNTLRVVAATIVILAATALYRPGFMHSETERSFFGVHRVSESADGKFRMLFHGTTLHGVQQIRDDNGAAIKGPPQPLTYYYDRGPMAEIIRGARGQKGRLDRVAIVGLGAGSMACHSRPGEQWRFFEIDPLVVRIARDPAKFRFLSDCGAGNDVVLGDARLTLADQSDKFDVIILDAFSSDVVPVHLLTREAMKLYLDRLKDGGVIAFHISNRYLELASVVAEVAATQGLVTLAKFDPIGQAEQLATMHAPSLVAVAARSEADMSGFGQSWRRQVADGSVRPWTDDYSNILAAIWRMQAGH